jgi:hypothetical protein
LKLIKFNILIVIRKIILCHLSNICNMNIKPLFFFKPYVSSALHQDLKNCLLPSTLLKANPSARIISTPCSLGGDYLKHHFRNLNQRNLPLREIMNLRGRRNGSCLQSVTLVFCS